MEAVPDRGAESERKPIRRGIEAIKATIPIEQVAAEYTELRATGDKRYSGRCPLPDHDDRTPSFFVYADAQDPHFHCFGCQMHGDAIDLEELAGRHGEAWTAMVALSVRYGVELPARSEKWRAWQQTKHAIEDLAENVRFQAQCRRWFKLLILNAPEIQGIEDPAERRKEIETCWEAFQQGMRRIRR